MAAEEVSAITELIKTGVPIMGTLLGGLLGYLTATNGNKSQLRRQNLEYDFNLLKESALHIHSFDASFHRYLIASEDFNEAYDEIDYEQNPDQELLDEMEDDALRLDNHSSELFGKNDEILLARSKLSLVGAKNTITALNEYDEMLTQLGHEQEKSPVKYQKLREENIVKINLALENDRKKL